MAKATASAGFENIKGKYQGVVIANTRTGLVIRRRPIYRRHVSPAQYMAVNRLAMTARRWSQLTLDEALAWNDFAWRQVRTSPDSGQKYRRVGFNAFVALGTKFLQVNPGAPLPLLPPSSPYLGDRITLVARPVEGGIEFEASGPTEPDTVVELLAERLPNIRRAATGRLSSLGFVSFTPDNLRVTVPADPGAFVPGYQFVRQSTGQVAGYRVLDRLEVPGD